MGLFDDDTNFDDDVDSIVNQIKNQSKHIAPTPQEKTKLTKDQIEEFILDNAATVVNDSVEMIQSLKNEMLVTADSKLIESVAELVKATTSAIDSLSKLKIADDKNKNQREIKQMDIDAKQNDSETEVVQAKLLMNREEMIKELLKEKNSKKFLPIPEDDAIDV